MRSISIPAIFAISCCFFILASRGDMDGKLKRVKSMSENIRSAAAGAGKKVNTAIKTFPRDAKFVWRLTNFSVALAYCAIKKENVISLFKRRLRKDPNRVALLFEDEKWTMKKLDEYSDDVARLFQYEGYVKGDKVALYCRNQVEYVATWLGLAKIGVVTALINAGLISNQLKRSIVSADCKAIIFGASLENELKEIIPLLSENSEEENGRNRNYQYFVLSKEPAKCDFARDLIREMAKPEIKNNPFWVPIINRTDKMLYIYTSGTTGLPKPAIITHDRCIFLAYSMKYLFNIRNDVIYNPLPLYHQAGGVLGIMPALLQNSSTVIVPKFSASNYIRDCVKYDCTVAQYIGEYPRYILGQPATQYDTTHNLRMIFGNGMKPIIWNLFVERFQVPIVTEFYGTTEGNSNILNIEGKVGAVGYLPRFVPISWSNRFVGLIKWDYEQDLPVRGDNGLCVRSEIGEPGMWIGMISKLKFDSVRAFRGYTDVKETEKKIIRNVFNKGDAAFLSGDIMLMDNLGYLYFIDRIGDTFRWKGENVSCEEIERIVSPLVKFKDCAVYGVQVQNFEGKVGMIAVVDRERDISLKELFTGIMNELSAHARPYFLRIVKDIEMTSTCKFNKTKLIEEGFDPNVIEDPLYFRDRSKGFISLTSELHMKILGGSVKLHR